MEIRPLHLPSEESLNGIKVYFITRLIYLMFSQLISLISSGLKQAQTACATPLYGMTLRPSSQTSSY